MSTTTETAFHSPRLASRAAPKPAHQTIIGITVGCTPTHRLALDIGKKL
jgi:hypothetical protein